LGSSLQDQLLKIGLVDKKQVKKANVEKRIENKQQRNSKTKIVDGAILKARNERAKKADRDRELNRLQEERAKRKSIAAQIKQLIELNRQPKDDDDIPYSFFDGKKIRKIYVSKTTQDQLGAGKLAIVRLAGRYELVPTDIAEKISARDERRVIFCKKFQLDEASTKDDPYADFKVPDDLIW